MFIPKFASPQLRIILANLDFGTKKEAAITHDLGEFFANSRMTTVLLMSERMSAQMNPPRKIIRSQTKAA